jgi:hypothetical protein
VTDFKPGDLFCVSPRYVVPISINYSFQIIPHQCKSVSTFRCPPPLCVLCGEKSSAEFNHRGHRDHREEEQRVRKEGRSRHEDISRLHSPLKQVLVSPR